MDFNEFPVEIVRNLSFYPIDLHLDPEQAQRSASQLGMLLALRSEEELWEDLHMRFCPQMKEVFQHYFLLDESCETLLPPAQRLRMLLSLVSDDLPTALGNGPGLKLEQWKKPKFYNCASFRLHSYMKS